MLVKLLEIRTMILTLYQKARFVINPLVKFIVSLMVYSSINGSIGYDTRFTSGAIVMLLSVISAVLPGGVMVFFAMMLTLLHIFSVSKFLAAILLLAFLILYGMLLRFTPKYIIAVVLLPLLAKYNLHYAVPLVLGCITTPLAILPTVSGVFVYYMMEIIKAASQRQVQMKLEDILQLYIDIADAVMADKKMYIMMLVFALVVAVVYVIRKFSFDYSFVISIGAGVLVNILGFLISDLRFNVTVKVGTLLIMSIVCGFIAYIVEFMKRILDYTGVERVQFEDDDYYYFVKAVPKIEIGIPRRNFRNISRDDTAEESSEEYEEYEEAEGEYEEEPAEEPAEEYEEESSGEYDRASSEEYDRQYDRASSDEYDEEPAQQDEPESAGEADGNLRSVTDLWHLEIPDDDEDK